MNRSKRLPINRNPLHTDITKTCKVFKNYFAFHKAAFQGHKAKTSTFPDEDYLATWTTYKTKSTVHIVKVSHLRYWIKVNIYNLVQIPNNYTSNLFQLFKVKCFLFDVAGQGYRSQVTHCNLQIQVIYKIIKMCKYKIIKMSKIVKKRKKFVLNLFFCPQNLKKSLSLLQ